MADETKPPPTYAELLDIADSLGADNDELKAKNAKLETALRAKDVDLGNLRVKKPRPARKLDPGAASAFNRPWNGR